MGLPAACRARSDRPGTSEIDTSARIRARRMPHLRNGSLEHLASAGFSDDTRSGSLGGLCKGALGWPPDTPTRGPNTPRSE